MHDEGMSVHARPSRRITLAAVTALAIVGPAAGANPAAPALRAPVSGAPITAPLTRVGKWMVDDQGRVVIFHGVDIMDKDSPFYPYRFAEQDARFLANEGFTATRTGFIWAGVEPQPGKYNDAYIAHMAAFNELLARYGIRTLIDFHQDGWRDGNGGDGAPGWATIGSNFLDNFQNFWDNAPAPDGVGIQTHFVNAWRHVVRMLDASPGSANVYGWDPFNEPYAGTKTGCAPFTPCPSFESGQLAAFYQREIAGIRSTSDRHVIFPEGIAQNGIAQPSLPKFSDPLTAFTFHYYCPITQSATGESPADAGCASDDQHGVGNFIAYADSLNVPSIVGEWSCSDANDENQRMVDLMDHSFLSWTIWAYYTKDPAGCPTEGLLLDDTKPGSESNAKQAKLDAIVVPYPQAIAGTPGSYAFDRSTDTMTLTYQATAVPGARLSSGALTQIFVPRRKYPHGYHVQATGAKLVSAPTAPWVELAAAPGASVSVTITPAIDSSTQLPLEAWRPTAAVCAMGASLPRGRSLGPVRLGMTRAQVRRHANCARQNRIRVGYASGRLLRGLSTGRRRRIAGRVVLILTSNRYYSLRGVRPGARLASAARRLHLGRPFRVGATSWYLLAGKSARGVLEVRRGVVRGIGIANPLFVRTARAARALFGREV